MQSPDARQVWEFAVRTIQESSVIHAIYQRYNQLVSVGNYNNDVLNQIVYRSIGWHQLNGGIEPLDSVVKFWVNYSIVECSNQDQQLMQYLRSNQPDQWAGIATEGNHRRKRLQAMAQQQQQPQQQSGFPITSHHAPMPQQYHQPAVNNMYAANTTPSAPTTTASSLGLAGSAYAPNQPTAPIAPIAPAAPLPTTPVQIPTQQLKTADVKHSTWTDFDGNLLPIGVDIKRSRPYDVFVSDDGKLWEVAHLSRYKLPYGKVASVVDYNEYLPYHCIDSDGTVKEAQIKVNQDNEYLANELMPTWLNRREEIRAKPNPIINNLLKSRQHTLERKLPTNAVIKDKEIQIMTAVKEPREVIEVASLREACNLTRGQAAASNASVHLTACLFTDHVFYRGDVVDTNKIPLSPVQIQEWLINRAQSKGDMSLVNALNTRLTKELNVLLDELGSGINAESYMTDIADVLAYYESTIGPNSTYSYAYFKQVLTRVIETSLTEVDHEGTHTDQALQWFKENVEGDAKPNPAVHLCKLARLAYVCYIDRDITDWVPNSTVGATVRIDNSDNPGIMDLVEALASPELTDILVYVLFSDGRVARVSTYTTDQVSLTEIAT